MLRFFYQVGEEYLGFDLIWFDYFASELSHSFSFLFYWFIYLFWMLPHSHIAYSVLIWYLTVFSNILALFLVLMP